MPGPAPPPAPGPAGARAHAFVASLEEPVLTDTDRHHLERVLRLRPGEPVTVSDGAGSWRLCRFGAVLEVAGPVAHEPRPQPALGVGFALVKGERPEWIVQKLTELGVDRIVPFVAERSVVRWDGSKAARHRERLAVVAREAAMQSRRVWLPEVGEVAGLAALVGSGVALADRGGGPPGLERPMVLVGPEGGWSDAERALGLPSVGLGPGVLRAETAAVAAGALLAALRHALVGETDPP